MRELETRLADGTVGELKQTTYPQPDSPATTQPSLKVHAARQPVSGSPEWCCLVTSTENGHEMTVFGDSADDATKRAHVAAAAQDMLKQLRWAVLKLEQLKSVAGHMWDADAYRECCRVVDDAMLAARKGGVACAASSQAHRWQGSKGGGPMTTPATEQPKIDDGGTTQPLVALRTDIPVHECPVPNHEKCFTAFRAIVPGVNGREVTAAITIDGHASVVGTAYFTAKSLLASSVFAVIGPKDNAVEFALRFAEAMYAAAVRIEAKKAEIANTAASTKGGVA